MALLFIFLFLLGASIGSFINAAALRFLARESFVAGRSRCPKCRVPLSWLQLIPVVSFLYLLGRCASCREPISIRYLLVEAGMGVIAVAVGFSVISGTLNTPFMALVAGVEVWPLLVLFLLYLAVSAAALFVFLVDFDSQTIPVGVTRVIAAGSVALLLLQAARGDTASWWTISASLAIAAFFVFVWAITKGAGMGLGDAELAGALSLFLTSAGAAGLLLFSFWIGAVFAVGLLLSGYSLKSRIPFGPFIVLGFFASLFWGKFALPYLLPFQ